MVVFLKSSNKDLIPSATQLTASVVLCLQFLRVQQDTEYVTHYQKVEKEIFEISQS